MDLQTLIYLYVALYIVILLHELGHIPEKIKFKFGIIPSAAAMRASSQLGGLMVNVLLFIAVFYYHPSNILLQYLGLISWTHFMIYSVVGSIVPEPKPSSVNISTYVFDDVPNEYGGYFILAAIVTFITLQHYYLPIFVGLF